MSTISYSYHILQVTFTGLSTGPGSIAVSGVEVGDMLIFVVDQSNNNFRADPLFESTVSVANEIQQIQNVPYSDTYLAMIIRWQQA